MSKIYHIMIEAKDKSGNFFQNFYPEANNVDEAINEVMNKVKSMSYGDLNLDSVGEINDIFDIEDLIESEGFRGFIQSVKHYY